MLQERIISDATQISPSIKKYGASGGGGGSERNMDSINLQVASIVKLVIRHGGILDAIIVHFRRFDGVESFYHLGGHGGYLNNEIDLYSTDEYIIGVRGCINKYQGQTVICSVEIETNFTRYGPYGQEHPDARKYQFRANGGQIIGFHGFTGGFIDAIGVYVKDVTTTGVNAAGGNATVTAVTQTGRTATGRNATSGTSNVNEWVINDATQIAPSIWKYGASSGSGGIESNTNRIDLQFARIVKLVISHGDILDAVFVHFQRFDNGVESIYHLGGYGGHLEAEINLTNEYIIGVRGCINEYQGATVVCSIEIETNVATYGPYGQEHPEARKYDFRANGGKIIGFHGFDGSFINAIGVYVKDEWLSNDVCHLSPTLSMIGPCGCTRGVEMDMNHVIRNIARIVKLGIRHGSGLDAIVIYYKRPDGSEGSYHFGGGGGQLTEVNFRPSEYIMRVRGSIGYVPVILQGKKYKNPTVKAVRSIEIYTNLSIYGPYGVDRGTDYDFEADGGQIIGFHGRALPWVYAIGVYVKDGTKNMIDETGNNETSTDPNTPRRNAADSTVSVQVEGAKATGGNASVNFYCVIL